MTRLQQHAISAHDATPAETHTVGVPADDDYAIGFESADPSLQFEAWEPLIAQMPASPMG
ncbi:hypothetical protein [Ramlibacter humi]|uniref:Uncharacterized protein n=1 Tax=Ramlibacter humi TaxID=2530451 RepID=A0A4Z0BXS7_9BURK|nr:hypothetical protein [Ramlibacter humi]TFZ04136.1 hypothetical protein EZ216_10930 [Ramlibacter humi]